MDQDVAFIEDGDVNLDALLGLYASVGWESYLALDPRVLQASISRADHTIQALADGGLIGFCRSLSDGVLYVMLQDVIVHPRYQRQGIGRSLVERLVGLYSHVPRKDYVRLFAEPGSEVFYRRIGFQVCPLIAHQLGLPGLSP